MAIPSRKSVLYTNTDSGAIIRVQLKGAAVAASESMASRCRLHRHQHSHIPSMKPPGIFGPRPIPTNGQFMAFLPFLSITRAFFEIVRAVNPSTALGASEGGSCCFQK
jgi:hypothetical protein